MSDDVLNLLSERAYRAEDVERFLDPAVPTWARFDPELGYVLGDIVMKDGMEGSCTFSRYEPGGQRRMLQFADRPCRVNTYGDSFTQCHQSSDGETWQEYLAAHLGEPIRNFGVGGYGVYQAYRRALRVEAGELAAPYVVLNIWDDDHVRNLDASRWLRLGDFARQLGDRRYILFHGNPWVHLRFDPGNSRFVERTSLCSTPDDLRRLCDADRFCETFKDDPIVRLHVLKGGGRVDRLDDLEALSEAFGLRLDLRHDDTRARHAAQLHIEYGLRATEYVLDRMRAWADAEGRRLMVLLSCRMSAIIRAAEGKPRFDQRMLDYLATHEIPFVDGLSKHVEDFDRFRISPQEYAERYYIGHYSPAGNHFFAFAVKNTLVDWLDPKPPAYCDEGQAWAAMAARLA